MFLASALESLNSLVTTSLSEWKEASKPPAVEKMSLPSPSKVLNSRLNQVYEKEPQIDELLNSIAMIRKDLMGRGAQRTSTAQPPPASSTIRSSIQPKQSITGTRTARFPTFDFPSIKRLEARNTLNRSTEEKEPVADRSTTAKSVEKESVKYDPVQANVEKAVDPSVKEGNVEVQKVSIPEAPIEIPTPVTSAVIAPIAKPEIILKAEPAPAPVLEEIKPAPKPEPVLQITTQTLVEISAEVVEDSVEIDQTDVNKILDESMELDPEPTPKLAEFETVDVIPSRMSIDPLTGPAQEPPAISKSEIPSNVYHGSATTFLPPNLQKQVVNEKPVYTFVPANAAAPKERPKPVIAALKTAELAAKKEKEERERKAKEKEMRKLAMEKKKVKPVPPKRAAPVVEEPRKKVALPVKKPLITTAGTSGQVKPKLPLPVKSQVKNPILVNLQKPTTLVDSNGEIIGLNEASSSDSEAPTPPKSNTFVPTWAQSPFLKKALSDQGKIDPDEIFTRIEKPNLKEIMGNTHRKTMSMSGNEQMEMISASEELAYKQQMGFKK